jgi:hypothetical protein
VAVDDSASRGVVGEIGRLAGMADPETAAAGYRQAVRDAYWEAQDLGAVTAFASAGYSHCLAAAAAAEGEAAYRLRSEAKALMYDLASFTWPGWGEPGVEVLERDLRIGLEAATANLRLAAELDKGDLPVSRALWMLGGHLLAAVRYSEAGERFSDGAVLAASAENSAEARLGEAFAALGSLLEGGAGAQQQYDDAIARLAAEEEGAALVEQVATARKVFAPSGRR